MYMDCVDLIAPLVGYDDNLTQSALMRVTDTLRYMKCSAYAKRYLAGLVKNLNSKVRATFFPLKIHRCNIDIYRILGIRK